MSNFICERCGLSFNEKRVLLTHLKRLKWCIAIEKDIEPSKLIEKIKSKPDGKTCDKCNKIYKNNNSLRMHKCKNAKTVNPDTIVLDEMKQIRDDMRNELNRLKDIIGQTEANIVANNSSISGTTQISNTLIDNSITNNITVNINSLKSTSEQQIQYLLNREDTTELFMNCLKSIDGIKKYINTKYYDPNHPENQMIRKSDNHNELELYEDKWKKYNNMDASDLILINIGNDLTHYLDSLLENDEEQYEKIKQNVSSLNKMLMIHFNIDLTDGDNDSSEEWGRSGHPKLINGSYVWIDDKDVEYEKVKRNKEKIQNMLIKHIHQK